MKYLTSFEEDSGGNTVPESKLSRYVEKQKAWAKDVEMFAVAQERQQSRFIVSASGLQLTFEAEIFTTQYLNNPAGQKEAFLQWLQSHSRDVRTLLYSQKLERLTIKPVQSCYPSQVYGLGGSRL